MYEMIVKLNASNIVYAVSYPTDPDLPEDKVRDEVIGFSDETAKLFFEGQGYSLDGNFNNPGELKFVKSK